MMYPLPWDMFRMYVHNCILFAGFAVPVYLLLKKSKSWTLLCLAIFLMLMENGYMPGAFRYCMSLDAVLIFLALQRLQSAAAVPYALFGLFLGWVGIQEPAQLLYASASLGIAALMTFLGKKQRAERKGLIRNLAVAALCFSTVYAAHAAVLAYRGQLAGFIEFNRFLQATSVGSLIPANLASWYALAPFNESFVLYSPLWLIATGIFFALLPKGHSIRQCSDIMLCLGALGMLIFEKHMIRPHMALQFMYLFVLGDFILLYYWSLCWNKLQNNIFLLLIVFSFTCTFSSWYRIAVSYADRAGSIAGNCAVLARGDAALAKNISAYYSPQAFMACPGARDFLAYYESLPKTERSEFYVLGDEGYFYILARQAPPYFVTFYNGCAIFYQQQILSWLEKKNIRRIIFNSATSAFDSVPNLVRVPVIFDYVIKNFVPVRQFSGFYVLERKRPAVSDSLSFWLARLGAELDLGYIPANTSAARMRPCEEGTDSASCRDMLEITVPPGGKSLKRHVSLRYGDYALKLCFQQDERVSRYYIPLDRIWFWSFLKAAGLKKALVIDYDADMQGRLVQKKDDAEILY